MNIVSRNRLKRVERNDTYLNHVCRLPLSIVSLERIDKKPKLSANTATFISCRSRLNIMLAGAAVGSEEKGRGGEKKSVINRFNAGRLFRFKYRLVCHFKLLTGMVGVMSWTRLPEN